jgi:L-threonylcarbamoyladenylate synthase
MRSFAIQLIKRKISMRISLAQAVSALQSGQVIAVPTETVYGLAASLNQPAAIEQIFALKGRPRANPLIIHIGDLADIEQYVTEYPPGFEALVQAFWPGPLTCILPVHASRVPALVRAGLPTAGFRMPALDLTRQLLRSTGPLVMPSANLSGRPSATRPQHVEEDFGADFPVLDGGVCTKGVESTILLYQEPEWVIVRLGALAPEQFQPVLGYQPQCVQKAQEAQPLCPGQLFRHYAPRARLFLGDSAALEEAFFVLGFKERNYPPGKRLIVMGSLFQPEEVAENLYQALRQLDQEGALTAWVDMNFPREGLWQTIAERLMRAGESLS